MIHQKNLDAYFYYQLLLIDTAANGFKQIKLYRFNNGRYNDTSLIKTVASGKKLSFNYKTFWAKNYKQLMQYP